MNTWVISYNSIESGNSLMYEYETIEGKNAKDALKKRFNKDFKRLTGDDGRYAEVILVKGYFENNTIYYKGNGARLCYSVQ